MNLFINVLIQFAGGLGLFVFGMKIMGDGLQKAAGTRMKKLLEILTTNRFLAVIMGALVTAIIQSSSATTVMLVGFVNAGLMSLAQATGVIMGANIGTTITAQLIAFNLTAIAPLAILLGVGMKLFCKKKSSQRMGEIIAGFGILFFGMDTMSGAMKPLRGNAVFQQMIINLENPIIGVLVGFSITAILQSSSASIGILQALAFQDLITIDSALPVLFGMNIGTCVTAMIASIGTNKTAKRTAVIHLLFNVIGTFIFLILIRFVPYSEFIKSLSTDTSRQIAHAHTIFNIVNTILLFPFANTMVNMSNRLVPGKEDDTEHRLKYLDMRILETPSIAVGQAIKEVARMGSFALQNHQASMGALIKKDEGLVNDVYEREKIINYLNKEITDYLIKISVLSLSSEQSQQITGLFHTVTDIERVGDHAENIVELAQHSIDHNLFFSDIAISELEDMNGKVASILEDSIESLKTGDKNLAKTVEPREDKIDDLEQQLRDSHIKRLGEQMCVAESGIIFLDAISNLERIADHASNIAFSVLNHL
ncbi:MAG: Na/Pi cotransporter family protein [Clostridia bacterium]|nr:Na/Pi cotransporter family protein [Clostridia bacterium]